MSSATIIGSFLSCLPRLNMDPKSPRLPFDTGVPDLDVGRESDDLSFCSAVKTSGASAGS